MANEKILASVGGKPITEADVDAFLASMGPRGQQYASPEGRGVILEQLVNQKLFLLDAQRNLYEAEAAFKAFARALRAAIAIDEKAKDEIPSTKGVL